MLFPTTSLQNNDIQTLKHGWSRKQHFDLGQLFLKYNILSKYIKNGRPGVPNGMYIWNIDNAIWEHNKSNNAIFAVMVKTYKNLIKRCELSRVFSAKEANKLYVKYQNIKVTSAIHKFIDFPNNQEFEAKLDALGETLPIANNKKNKSKN